MVIKDLKKYLSKENPSLNLTRELNLSRKYQHLLGIEDTIKNQMRDYAFRCWREDWDKDFRIEISLGVYAIKDPDLKKERAVEFTIAEDYLKNIREKKVIKKYYIYFWQSRFTGSNPTVRLRITFKPRDIVRFY